MVFERNVWSLFSTMIQQLLPSLALWPRWLFAAPTEYWLFSKRGCSHIVASPSLYLRAAPLALFPAKTRRARALPFFFFFSSSYHELHLCTYICAVWPHNTDLQLPPPSSSPLPLSVSGSHVRPILFPILPVMPRWFLCPNNAFNRISTDCRKCKTIISLRPSFHRVGSFFLWTHC